MKYTCYFDGSYRDHNNKEDMGIGCVVLDEKKNTVFELSLHLKGEGSTNYAEYSACVEVLRWLTENPHESAIVRGDSKLVANQLNGLWKVRKGVYMSKAEEAKQLFKRLPKTEIKWTSRNNNVRADELSKMGLNGDNFINNKK